MITAINTITDLINYFTALQQNINKSEINTSIYNKLTLIIIKIKNYLEINDSSINNYDIGNTGMNTGNTAGIIFKNSKTSLTGLNNSNSQFNSKFWGDKDPNRSYHSINSLQSIKSNKGLNESGSGFNGFNRNEGNIIYPTNNLRDRDIKQERRWRLVILIKF